MRQVAAQLRQEQLVGRRVRPLPMGKRGTGHTAVAGCPIEAGRSATDPRPSGPSVGEGGAAPASDRARNDLQMQAEGRGEGPVLDVADANRFFVRGASSIGLEALSPNRKDDPPAVAKALYFIVIVVDSASRASLFAPGPRLWRAQIRSGGAWRQGGGDLF